jgi:hypothetical protein
MRALGIDDQQHNSAGQRERPGHGWDEVSLSGLEVHTENIHWLAATRETDARVGKHNDAQRNQDNRDDGFGIHFYLSAMVVSIQRVLHSPASTDEIDQDHDNGNYQKGVNETAHRGAGQQSQQPQNDEYDGYSPQHKRLLSPVWNPYRLVRFSIPLAPACRELMIIGSWLLQWSYY